MYNIKYKVEYNKENFSDYDVLLTKSYPNFIDAVKEIDYILYQYLGDKCKSIAIRSWFIIIENKKIEVLAGSINYSTNKSFTLFDEIRCDLDH